VLAKIEAIEKRMEAIGHEQTLIRVIGLLIAAVVLGWFVREVTAPRIQPPAAQADLPATGQPLSPTELGPARQTGPAQPLTPPQGSATRIEPSASQPTTPDSR
jgi:hypothetical protein